MAKFKVGDKVKILDGSNIEDYEGSWVNSMKKYVNKVFTIRMIDEINVTEPRYFMKEIPYIWDERGLELITKQESIIRGSVDQTLNNKGEYFTGKVRCVRVDVHNRGWLTKGKVYTFVNGYSIDDMGDKLPILTQIHSVEELNKTLYSDFEEVKFDWDGFKAGKFNVIVNSKNIDHFLEECDEHKIKWTTVKATKFNPIKDLDDVPPIIKFLIDAEQTEKCDLEVEDGGLKYSFKLDIRDETVIYD